MWLTSPESTSSTGARLFLETRSPATANNRYRGLQAFWKFLGEEGEVGRNPMRNMKPPMLPEQQVPILTDDELKKLLNTCRGNDFAARRDMAIHCDRR